MRLVKIISVGAALAAASSVHAFGIGARVGTTGVGADVGWRVAPTLSARLGYSALSWSKDVSTDLARYDGKLKLSNLSGMLDFSPLGPFRLTGGLILNDNKYDLRAERSGGSLEGTVKAGRSAAPYLGIGYGNVAGLGVNFYADFGLIFQGSPKATLNANCGSLSAGPCTTLRNEAAAEQARLEDKLRNFKYYPVVNIGLTIGF